MNDDRFDAMVRQLSTARSRRSALRIFGGALVGTAATALFGTGRAGAVFCPFGQTCCPLDQCLAGGGTCVNTFTDSNNCGFCGHVCTGATCANGFCLGGCPQGQTLCGNVCKDTASDPKNCGGCSTTCVQGAACVNGSCQSQCQSGQTLCGGKCVDTRADGLNCGLCGHVCMGFQECVSGTCVESCFTQYPNTTRCGGVCVNVNTDVNHCGSCHRACPPDHRKCENGACLVP